MDFMTFYAIAVGALLATLFLIRTTSYLSDFKDTLLLIISKYLIYPNLLDRHRLIGPWSYASALLYLAYAVTNGLTSFYDDPSLNGLRCMPAY